MTSEETAEKGPLPTGQQRRRIDRAERFIRAAAAELRGVDLIAPDVRARVRSNLDGIADVLAFELRNLPAQTAKRSRPWRLWAALPGGPGSLTLHGTYATKEAAEKAAREWRKKLGGPTSITNREDDEVLPSADAESRPTGTGLLLDHLSSEQVREALDIRPIRPAGGESR